MAIDPKKLLPPSKITSSLVAPSFSGLSINKQSAEVRKVTELSKRYNEQNIDIMRKSLLDVDALIKSVLGENRTTEENKRRRREREEFEERESRLELPREQKKFRLPQVSLPGMSFLDRVKRFLLFTGIGWLFTNFQSQLPKLLGIIKIITPIYNVVSNVFKFILSSVVNFIDRGYETYDKIRAIVKSVGGETSQQDFDALSSKLNEYINYILIGGMALTGAIAAFTANVSKIRAPQPRPVPAPARPIAPVGKPATSVATATAKSGGKLAQRALAKNLIRTTVKPVLARLPIVGALVEFGLSWALGDPVSKAAFRGIGSLLVGAVGTAIGGPIGAAIGGVLGGEVGGKVYDVLFGGNKPPAYRNGGRVIRAYARGGGVLGAYELGRTIEVKRATKATPPVQTTLPGSDVGGVSQIQRIYPSPMDFRKPNPYNTLTDTARDLKGTPYGLGALMGGAIDVALGQKLSNSTILNASVGLENMFYDNYDREDNFIDVRSIIFGVIKSAADSALMNIKDELGKGKKKEEEKKDDSAAPGAVPGPTPGAQPPASGGGAPSPSGGSLVATGINDYKGRQIKLKGAAGDAFIDMANEAKKEGIDLGPAISSSYRSLEDQIRVYKDKYGANWKQYMVWKSRHMEGNAFDINWDSKGGVWIRNNASRFGFKFNSYSGDSSHFDWVGGYTPKSKIAEKQYAVTPPTVKPPSAAASSTSPSGPAPKGGTLSTSQLISVARQAGFDEKTATIMGAVAFAESSGRSGVSRSDTDVHGLWQIRFPVHQEKLKRLGITSREQLYDPLTNAKAAKAVYDSQGISAWSAYTNGAYKQYLPKAKKGGLADSISPSGNYVLPKDSSTDTKLLEQYPSYSEGGMRTRLAVQRVIVEKVKPIPMPRNSKTSFAIAGGGVNNNMALNRG